MFNPAGSGSAHPIAPLVLPTGFTQLNNDNPASALLQVPVSDADAVLSHGRSGSSLSLPAIDPDLLGRKLDSFQHSPPASQPQALAFFRSKLYDRVVNTFVPHVLSSTEIEGFRGDTAECIREIQGLESSLTNMQDEQTRLRLQFARMNYDMRFPRLFRINDLPSEIVVNIFRFVSWSAADHDSGVRGRLWLTWVCRRWRMTVLQDASIWSIIWFRGSPPFNRALTWLERASNTPLDVRVGDYDDHRFSVQDMEALLDKIWIKVSNIRYFIAIVTDWEPVMAILDKFSTTGLEGNLLNIERFELHRMGSPFVQIGGASYQPRSLRERIPLFGGAHVPSLRYFSINGIHLNWSQTSLSNLTALDLRRITPDISPHISKFREVLQSSPALHKLCLDAAGPRFEPGDATDLPAISLGNLKILVLANLSVRGACTILSLIAARNVRDLTLLSLGPDDLSPLFATLTSRFPDVRILTLYYLDIPDNDRARRVVIKWLDSIPLLRYLRIASLPKVMLEFFLYDPQTLRHLFQEQSVPRKVLCPHLSFLDWHKLSSDLVATWIDARRNLNAPLSKVFIPKHFANGLTLSQYGTLRFVAPVFLLDKLKTPEETEIMRE